MTKPFMEPSEKAENIVKLHSLSLTLEPEDIAETIYFPVDLAKSCSITEHIVSINAKTYINIKS